MRKKTALILAGGGARNAYQVGVLSAVMDMIPHHGQNPFDIIAGSSSGGINAGVLATRADDIPGAIKELRHIWSKLHTRDIFLADNVASLRAAASTLWSFARKEDRHQPHSIFDNSPLRALLSENISASRIQANIDTGALHAVGITSTSYSSGRSVTHFMANSDVQPWQRSRRDGVRQRLCVDHFMASSAIPMIFPAVRLGDEYFCDGSIRLLSPLSTGLRLGADKLFVISVSNQNANNTPQALPSPPNYPSTGEIAGYVFETLFMEALEMDLERMQRINYLAKLTQSALHDESGKALKPVDSLVMTPSRSISGIISQHENLFPKDLQLTLRLLGGNNDAAQLLSYLCFEGAFCQDLIELGYEDAMAREAELYDFFADTSDNDHSPESIACA